MKTRPLILVSLSVAAAMIGFAFLTAGRLPADAVLPVHWNAAGQADRFSPALPALLMPAGVVLLATLIFAAIPRIEPLQQRLEASSAVLRASWLGLLGVMLVIEAAIGLAVWGIALPVKAIMLAMGLMLVWVGNVLPKSRPGFFVGIRTPWTLTDTDNWIATHRLGGKLMMAAGAAIAVASLLPIPPETTAIVVLVAVAIGAGVPLVYSWWYWNRRKRQA